MHAPSLQPCIVLVRANACFCLLLGLALTSVPFASQADRPDIQVMQGGWGSGEPAEIGKVLAAVADEFPAPPGHGARPSIRIRHRFGGPMIDYDRDREGWIVVHLSARDERWYQYVYQFAHEYCHALSHFDRKQRGDEILRDHQWFEEALCEAASLFALRRLSAKWSQDVEDAQLREASLRLAQYLAQLLAEPQRRLDAGTEFPAWYARHREALQREPYLRESNELIATQLLPLFERDPSRWAALAYLHPATPLQGQSFADFLTAWSEALPPALKPLVAEIRTVFGILAAGELKNPPTPPGTRTGSGS